MRTNNHLSDTLKQICPIRPGSFDQQKKQSKHPMRAHKGTTQLAVYRARHQPIHALFYGSCVHMKAQEPLQIPQTAASSRTPLALALKLSLADPLSLSLGLSFFCHRLLIAFSILCLLLL